MGSNVTNETLELIKAAQQNDISKTSTFTQSSNAVQGLTAYDLEAPAKKLYPVLTPLRNTIPRVSGKGGIQANWRAITAINPTGVRAGVSGGNRGAMVPVTVSNYIAAYAGLGLETAADFEADFAAEGFDDVKARAVTSGLESLMLQEEYTILGGNNSVAFGQTATPALVGSTTGGTLAANTWSVICVGLSMDGFINGSVTGGIQAQISRTNTDGSTDTFGGGAAKQSANATVTTTGTTSSIAATVTAQNGAVGYAWFWGPSAGSEVLGAITSINSIVITAAAAGTQTAASLGTTDYSQNSLVFDGLLTQAFKPGSNAYIKVMPTGTAGTGTPLTADGSGGINEIDAALKSLWDNWRLSPDEIWVNSQQALNISQKILTTGSTGAQRFVFNTEQAMLAGGVMVREYLNRYSMGGAMSIPIKIHPNMPAGTILIVTHKLPYPMSNVSNVIQMRLRRDYYQIEWPLRSRRYEYGVYMDGVLQNYAPFSMAVITNIAAG
ncbi:MAG: hypothetical protein JO253_03610 [Alphaproteobacteria bacterium]|nr:hypothetical protein [Alphaproteobacteria bacterium]